MTRPARKTSRPAAAAAWLSRSVSRLFGKKKKPAAPPKAAPPKKSPPPHAANRPLAPTKAETALLPLFSGLPLERIHLPRTKAECDAAVAKILAAGVAGFDTESRPTFNAGEKSTGPHVVQFALTDHAYIFQLRRPDCLHAAADLISSDRVLKVGFGLKNDHGQIHHRLGVKIHNVLDLDHVFRRRGYKGQIGVRGAIGAILNQSFPKSKSTTTSNWSAADLTPRQLAYAANDAYAALKIMEALDPKELFPPKKSDNPSRSENKASESEHAPSRRRRNRKPHPSSQRT